MDWMGIALQASEVIQNDGFRVDIGWMCLTWSAMRDSQTGRHTNVMTATATRKADRPCLIPSPRIQAR